jgi:hypothetical protein
LFHDRIEPSIEDRNTSENAALRNTGLPTLGFSTAKSKRHFFSRGCSKTFSWKNSLLSVSNPRKAGCIEKQKSNPLMFLESHPSKGTHTAERRIGYDMVLCRMNPELGNRTGLELGEREKNDDGGL